MRSITATVGALSLPVFFVCFAADGEQPGCSAKDFRGTYALRTDGVNISNNTPVMIAGSLTADGNGRITAWKDWAVTVVPPNVKTVSPLRDIHQMAQSIGNEIEYTVEPDCRMIITSIVPGPAGVLVPLRILGALAGAGDEALLLNGAPESPNVNLTTLKRAKPASGDDRR